MKTFKFLSLHKTSILSWLLVVAAVLLGAEGSFAMAETAGAAAELAPDPNPSDNMNEYNESTNPTGRPAGEALQTDENGGKTQLQGKAATATDVRDAGLEADDYDKKIDNFRRFRFPIETYIANRCTPVKCKNYIHSHYRSASTDIDAVYNQAANLTLGQGAKTVSIPVANFDNPECIIPYSQVFVGGASGYKKDDLGNEVEHGELVLFCKSYPDSESGNVEFEILNPSTKTENKIVIPGGAIFRVGAPMGSESQMHVAPETYLPEKRDVFLQKKIATCVITDEMEGQDKKVPFGTKDVKQNTIYNFKRKCARSHWLSTSSRLQVKVKELNNAREDAFSEEGILHQIPMVYVHGNDLVDDDLIAISSLMFTDYAVTERATAFCGKREIRRIMKLVNSATHFKDVSKVQVNEYGIKVRKWVDNFGEIEFVYDPTLDDIGYSDFMVLLDLDNAVRYYKLNDKESTRDMSKTGEAREAKEYNICRIDCIALRGFNAVLVGPQSAVSKTKKLSGVLANALKAETITQELDKTKIYYITSENRVVEWDVEFQEWVDFEGKLNA